MLKEKIPYSHQVPYRGAAPGSRPALHQPAVVISRHHLNASGVACQPGRKVANDVLRHSRKRVDKIAEKENLLCRPSIDKGGQLIQLAAKRRGGEPQTMLLKRFCFAEVAIGYDEQALGRPKQTAFGQELKHFISEDNPHLLKYLALKPCHPPFEFFSGYT